MTSPNQQEESDISDCPCCGGIPEAHCGWSFWIMCTQCGLQTDGFDSLEPAMDVWNRRVDSAVLARSRIEEIEQRVRDLEAACGQASFALRELLPNDPDAQMTVRMLSAVLNKEQKA